MKIQKLRAKEYMVNVIQWTNNEPEIREFVSDDFKLRFNEDKLRVWNSQLGDWMPCAMFDYIAKNEDGFIWVLPKATKENKFEEV